MIVNELKPLQPAPPLSIFSELVSH